jgi:DSBA-like thioredoxin domain
MIWPMPVRVAYRLGSLAATLRWPHEATYRRRAWTDMYLVIYGDFNCPFSALASARAQRLERSETARVDWRAVEHDPDIPPGGEPVDGVLADEVDGELEQVRGLLRPHEDVALCRPPRRSNTRAAVETYAATNPERRQEVRAELFERYWARGQDIGDEQVLAPVGAVARAPHTMSHWRKEWLGFGQPIVPTMRLPDERVIHGVEVLARLADLLRVAEPAKHDREG